MVTEYDLGNVIGPQGSIGLQGVSVSNASINAEGNLIVTLSNGNTIDAGFVKGDRGDKGDKGKSAYEQAQEGGYAGTEAQFIVELNSISSKANIEDCFIPYTSTYTFTTHRHTLTPEQTGLALPDIFAARFVAAAGFAAGDTVYLDGVEYTPTYTDSGAAVEAGAWVAGAVVTLTVDKGEGKAYVGAGLGAALSKKANKTEVSRTNILDNGDFGPKVINQRGQATYSATGGVIYTVDKWRTISSGSVAVGNGGVTVTSVAGGFGFEQLLESFAELDGCILTLSALVGDVVYSGTAALDTSQNYIPIKVPIGATGFTLQLRMIPPQVCLARLFAGASGSTALVRAMKLEVGDYQTLAHQDTSGGWVLNDPPPNPATELARCQRYQLAVDKLGGIRHSAEYINPSFIDFFIPTPCTMRATPALPQTTAVYSAAGVKQDGFTLAASTFSNGVQVRAAKSGHGLTGAFLRYTDTGESPTPMMLDANL